MRRHNPNDLDPNIHHPAKTSNFATVVFDSPDAFVTLVLTVRRVASG